VADDENLDIAREFGFETVETPNDHLGRKFNDGLEYAGSRGADFLVLIGSDDWMHIDLFNRMPLADAEPLWPTDDEPAVVWSPGESEALTGREIALVDMSRGVLRRCRSRGRSGVIPWVFPREVLETCGFRPLPDSQAKGIDGALLTGLHKKPRWVFTDPHDLCRVDFKSDVNLNSYDLISRAIGYGDEELAWPLLAERYPADIVEMARAASGETLAVAA
jgi:hypothetical protein